MKWKSWILAKPAVVFTLCNSSSLRKCKPTAVKYFLSHFSFTLTLWKAWAKPQHLASAVLPHAQEDEAGTHSSGTFLCACCLSCELISVVCKVITRLPFCCFIVPQTEAKTPRWALQMTTLTTPPVKSTRWENCGSRLFTRCHFKWFSYCKHPKTPQVSACNMAVQYTSSHPKPVFVLALIWFCCMPLHQYIEQKTAGTYAWEQCAQESVETRTVSVVYA